MMCPLKGFHLRSCGTSKSCIIWLWSANINPDLDEEHQYRSGVQLACVSLHKKRNFDETKQFHFQCEELSSSLKLFLFLGGKWVLLSAIMLMSCRKITEEEKRGSSTWIAVLNSSYPSTEIISLINLNVVVIYIKVQDATVGHLICKAVVASDLCQITPLEKPTVTHK